MAGLESKMTLTYQDVIAALDQFKKHGTGSLIDHQLLQEFPLFDGSAPTGHPYPQAFTNGASDEVHCFVHSVDDDLILLSRTLPSGCVISIDTMNFEMLNGGRGIAHLNFNNFDNRIENLKYVDESEARNLLMTYVEPNVEPN